MTHGPMVTYVWQPDGSLLITVICGSAAQIMPCRLAQLSDADLEQEKARFVKRGLEKIKLEVPWYIEHGVSNEDEIHATESPAR
jgi:hypothetical protein